MEATRTISCDSVISNPAMVEIIKSFRELAEASGDIQIRRASDTVASTVSRYAPKVRKAGASIMPFGTLIPVDVTFTVIKEERDFLHFRMDKLMRTSCKGQESKESKYTFDITLKTSN